MRGSRVSSSPPPPPPPTYLPTYLPPPLPLPGGENRPHSPYLKSSRGIVEDMPRTKWEEMAGKPVGRSWYTKKVSGGGGGGTGQQ